MRSRLLGAAIAIAAGATVLSAPAAVGNPDVGGPDGSSRRASILTYNGVTNGGRISPNGDGRLDTLTVSYGLTRKARVTAVIRTKSRPVRDLRRVDLGVQRAGGHKWRWNGRIQHRRIVPDGGYTVRLIAAPTGRRPGRSHFDVPVSASRHFANRADWVAGFETRFAVSRDAVYPDTTAVTDGVVVVAESLGAKFAGPTIQVRSAAKQVVTTIVPDAVAFPRNYYTWRGTDGAGARLPNGAYAVTASWQDGYGNRLTYSKPVSIKSGSLHLVEQSTTVSAASGRVWDGYTCSEPAPLNCAHSPGSTPSSQFPDGLTFAGNGIGSYHGSVSGFAIELPWALDPMHDQFRISYTGAPTSPGDAASDTAGELWSAAEVQATTTAGGTTTTGWGRSDDWRPPSTRPYVAGRIAWSFSNPDNGTSYDVASFTVDVRHWAPPVG